MGCSYSMQETFETIDETFGSKLSAPSQPLESDTISRLENESNSAILHEDEEVSLDYFVMTRSSPWQPVTCYRNISFCPNISIREFSVVIGDHPCCQDALPLSLDWSYEDMDSTSINETAERLTRYSQPKRLTYMERKLRLKEVGGLSEETLRKHESAHLGQMYDVHWGNLGRGKTMEAEI